MILKYILQSIFVKHQKYYDNVSNNFNIELIKKDLKAMDKTLIELLFNEILFVFFFTLNINEFKLIDSNKFEQELEHINEEVNIYDFHILTNLLNDKDFCKSCSILHNNYYIINMNKIMEIVQNLKEINTSYFKIKNNSSLITNIFIYKSYKTILKNIDFNCDVSLLKENKYSTFMKDYTSIFYQSIEIKKNIENIKHKNLNKKVKINILKVYFKFPFLEEILPLSKDSNIIDLDFFCDKLLDLIFIDNIYYDEFINSINYIFSEIDKPFNFFSFTEDLTISITDLDVILENDLNFFQKNILTQENTNKNNKNYLCTFTNRFGINGCKQKTFQEIANILHLKRQRIEQMQKTLISEYAKYSTICTNVLIDIIEDLISKSDNLTTVFLLLRKHFSNDNDFYFYLESICNKSLNYIKNLLSPNIDMRIFEEYSLVNKMPFSYDEVYNIIEESNLIDKKFVNYSIDYLVKIGKIKITKSENPLFIPIIPTIPTMYSQILLSHPDGQDMNDTVFEINSLFNITTTNRQSMDMDRYKSVYLYGQSKYRHVSFFYSTYTENDILNILQQIYNFLSTSNVDKNIHQCIQYLKTNNIEFNYYDLRYIVKKYGSDFTPPILLAGKSNADIVSLNQPKGKSLKTIIMDFVNKSKEPFTLERFYQKIDMQHNTIDTTFFNLLKDGKLLSRVDGFHFAKPSIAFDNKQFRENSLITAINTLFNSISNKSITIAFLEDFLNKNLKLTYHKYWYLSFIRFHKDKFKHIYEFESNVLNLNNNNQSLTTIIKNLLIECNYDKLLVEERTKDIVLCTTAEMKSTISSVISREKTNIINKDNNG